MEARTHELELQEMKRIAMKEAYQTAKQHYKRNLQKHLDKLKEMLEQKGQELKEKLTDKVKDELQAKIDALKARKVELEEQYAKHKEVLHSFVRNRTRDWLWKSLADFRTLQRYYKSWREFDERWHDSYTRQCEQQGLTEDEQDECARGKKKYQEVDAATKWLLRHHRRLTFRRIRERLHNVLRSGKQEEERQAEENHRQNSDTVQTTLNKLYSTALDARQQSEDLHTLGRRRRYNLQQFYNKRLARWRELFEARQKARTQEEDAAIAARLQQNNSAQNATQIAK